MKIDTTNRGRLNSREDIKAYILAGRGVVTLRSPTNVEHTYVFRRPDSDSDFPDDIVFVYAAHIEDDGNAKLFYIGMIEGEHFRLTRSSRFLPDTSIVRGAKYLINKMPYTEYSRMIAYHNGVCGRCGRRLDSADGMKHGFGKKCASRIKGSSNEHS